MVVELVLRSPRLKRILVWYLPQAVLFCLGVWWSISVAQPGQSGIIPVVFGVIFAGIPTMLVVWASDVPRKWRAFTRAERLGFSALAVALVASPIAMVPNLTFPPPIGAIGVVVLLLTAIMTPVFLLILQIYTDLNRWLLSRRERIARRDRDRGQAAADLSGKGTSPRLPR